MITPITTRHDECIKKARALALTLKLPFYEACVLPKNNDFFLLLTPDNLSLANARLEILHVVNFLAKQIRYRVQKATRRNELLARVLGNPPKESFSADKIIDCTAGFGKDSFILSSLGYQVTMLEQSPTVFALLQDGLRRAQMDPHYQDIVMRLTLIQSDARLWLDQNENPPDIIYLDPMFPIRKKSALAQKEMILLQSLVPANERCPLLHAALACARKRVVVKRPRLAGPLENFQPTFSLHGKSSRFDVYITSGQQHYGYL